ncbi:VPLPA-CTERM sorting domain-containing protein [Tropicimonas sp.]|uniref:VPLPA-CTERM sorting domain-containing protein n=1 Tax=Tropicimonas sp. TaxID=2067044 RepID=UPI003A8A7F47
MKNFLISTAVIAAAMTASAASALTVSFSLDDARGSVPMPTNVTLEDVAGGVKFSYAVDSSVVEGDVVAVYFNLLGDLPLSYSFEELAPDDSFITAQATNTSNVQAGNIGEVFDFGLAIGTTGLKGGSDQYLSFSFTMFASDLDVTDFYGQTFAARGQSIGQNGDSAKQFGVAPTAPGGPSSEVPLPAAGWLLVSGMGGLVALGRRRKSL